MTLIGYLVIRNSAGHIFHKSLASVDAALGVLTPVEAFPDPTSYNWHTDCLTFRLKGTRVPDEVSVEEPVGHLAKSHDFAMAPEDVAIVQAHAQRLGADAIGSTSPAAMLRVPYQGM